HRAGTIDKGISVAHEACGGGSKADAHLVVAGLGAGVAEGSAGIDTAGARDGTGACQYRFEKCGFTALEWAHQRDAPGTAGTSDVLSHSPPSLVGARPLIGSAANAPPVPAIWQAGKRRCAASSDSRSLSRKFGASRRTLPSRPQFQALEPGRNVQADLALNAERLQRDRIVR